MFLKNISQNIILSHGNNLARIGVVFPNKRAALWMNDYLCEASSQPVFAPKYFPISELFQQNSQLQIADKVKLVCLLHQVYCRVTGEDSTLDQFFAWGEVLLSDFDNIDKSLAPADKLLKNVTDLHEMDDTSFLDEEQKKLLMHFFKTFTQDHNSHIQQRFKKLWNNLYSIYEEFRKVLRAEGISYEGMLYRDVVSNISAADFPLTHYYIIGFNQLLPVEQKLFEIIGEKIVRIDDPADVDCLREDAKITIAQSLTDDLQARYVEQWLTQERIAKGRKTAIVLCDETLLPNVVYSLPENVGEVNITAGFPLVDTMPASYMETLVSLLSEGLTKDGKRFRRAYVRNLENHPLHDSRLPAVEDCQNSRTILDYCLNTITAMAGEIREENELIQEALFRVYNLVCRLKSLSDEGYLQILPITLARLFRQLLQSTTVPFNGKPAEGVQIMGMLETRNLDFDSVLVLSCNEGQMPKSTADNSVLPYSVKKAYGLSTSDDRVCLFAYYFYRLLKRCRDITLVYNASGSDTSPGEMSRFLLNLVVTNSEKITKIALQTCQLTHTKQSYPQEKKTDDVQAFLKRKMITGISPSAINVYMRCEKAFYYQYFLELREDKDEDDDTLDAMAFGLIFHKAVELMYKEFVGKTITKDILMYLLKNKSKILSYIDQAIMEEKEEGEVGETGMENLLREIVLQYILRLLKNDMKLAPFDLLSLEKNYFTNISVNTPFGQRLIKIGGAVDRLDCICDSNGNKALRVLDYKTGKPHEESKIKQVADIFDRTNESAPYYRQAILYSIALSEDNYANPDALPVIPALYYTRVTGKESEDYSPILSIAKERISDIREIKDEYRDRLTDILNEIFNKPTFAVSEDEECCTNCPYHELCKE